MNGVHDMGGMQGFGPVRPEVDEPLFHAAWERKALAITVAMGACGQWNIDLARSARESLPAAQYLGSSYYAIWLAGLEQLMLSRGMVGAAELKTGRSETAPFAGVRRLDGAQTAAALARGTASSRDAPGPARRVLPSGSACGRARCTPQAIPVCRAMCAATPARLRACTARMCSPTPA